MIKNIKHNLALKLDMWGFSASTICAIHCALMPFIIVFLPMLGLQFIANPIIELIFISTSLLIGAFTFRHGYYNHHRKIYPFIIFISGFAIIIIGHLFFFNHSHDVIPKTDIIHNENVAFLLVAPIGAFIIAVSHLINRKLSKNPKFCFNTDQNPVEIENRIFEN